MDVLTTRKCVGEGDGPPVTPTKLPKPAVGSSTLVSASANSAAWPFSPITGKQVNVPKSRSTTDVSVKIEWPSKTTQRKLPEELE